MPSETGQVNSENTDRTSGMQGSSALFSSALQELAISRGYKNSHSLSEALGKKTPMTVFRWWNGANIPLADNFGNLLALLNPNDEELEKLLMPYEQLLQEGKGTSGGIDKIHSNKNRVIKTPVGQWLKGFREKNKLTVPKLSLALGQDVESISKNTSSIIYLSKLSQNAPEKLNLTQEETMELRSFIKQAIQQKREQRQRFKPSPTIKGTELRKLQSELGYQTFNGPQAAKRLKVSRATISKWRLKLDLPSPLTKEQLDFLARSRNPDHNTGGRPRKNQIPSSDTKS